MKFILNIGDIPTNNITVNTRHAVRAIIFYHEKVLMILNKHGDLKFPGGGINPSETAEEALRREVKEETGYIKFTIIELLGKTIQRNLDIYDTNAMFEMESSYYLCRLDDEQNAGIQLDDYERELDFRCGFYRLEQALDNNLKLLKEDKTPFKWLKRETAVLQELVDLDIFVSLLK
jgi:8-oxo-dGTP pyrophosphatase MutT (NUDIX family)